ncbi:MAG TPA: hypothetical protein ENH34_04345 [Phycisphaerales bacterium]|nr:hypothetical protein [Phycisphaerales bacterium]
METSTNEMSSREIVPTLQLKRPLLPIDEYAAREGISRGIVEECAKLGVVQIRKYKGKTFVIDVPLSPYPHTPDTTADPIQPIDKTAQAGKISELVQKVIPDTPESAQITQDSGIQFGFLTAQARSKRIWQIVAVFSTVFLFTALFGNLWFYMDRKIQLDRIDLAYASIQQFLNDSTQAKQQVKTLQNELVNSRAELVRVQNELNSSRAEVKTARNELTRTRQDIKTIQQRNARTVERINQQIQKFIGQIPEPTKTGPVISGR